MKKYTMNKTYKTNKNGSKKTKNMVGKKYGHLEVLCIVGKDKFRTNLIACLCDCGEIVEKRAIPIRQGIGLHCGCSYAQKRHGMFGTRFYGIWDGMKYRCENDDRYVKKGVKVCKRWKKFENFMEDMYESYIEHVEKKGEKQTTIDRIDNNGNYEPNNCRWADYKTQVRNSSRYDIDTTKRKCWSCKKTKKIDMFYHNKSDVLGKCRECKNCCSIRGKKRWIKKQTSNLPS